MIRWGRRKTDHLAIAVKSFLNRGFKPPNRNYSTATYEDIELLGRSIP